MSLGKLLWKRREVMFMDLATLGYRDIKITEEQDKGFITKKVEKNINHFWKGGPGWTGRNIRYLTCKGHALVSWIKGTDEKVEGTIKEYLEFIWGKKAYANMNVELRDAIEKQIGVVVTVEPNIAADQTAQYMIDRLQAETLLTDPTVEAMQGLGQNEEKKPWTQSIGEKIPWMALGGLILYLALHNNIIR